MTTATRRGISVSGGPQCGQRRIERWRGLWGRAHSNDRYRVLEPLVAQPKPDGCPGSPTFASCAPDANGLHDPAPGLPALADGVRLHAGPSSRRASARRCATTISSRAARRAEHGSVERCRPFEAARHGGSIHVTVSGSGVRQQVVRCRQPLSPSARTMARQAKPQRRRGTPDQPQAPCCTLR